ncbi:MAG: lytic transglycosylase, partial [Muribaculaceae bacterium]|nr:lytic transglycosylase [Muribaculaceae bacterium]
MNIIRHIITVAAVALTAVSAGARPAANILDLTTAITDTAIVFPESYQTDVHRMQQNWYLQNFTVLDNAVSSPVAATDEVIIGRLSAMPTTIEMPFNQVVRSHIDLYVNRRRQLVEAMLGMSLYY